ncbi:DinB family protein [Christiangramia sp. SM2212]|uniref:DinB family protein n=1 Tax=Christiangramia sediminicola TaxID=3073267 RepID=A0ABU1ERH9_9FLAO|nr:DinB family protein [Christiangramia sp. SM2212]MDR5590992.1 DinB family protein [Christiangramia sp. SM2212]
MKIHEFLIPQLQQEVALTEKFLKRIPEDEMGWKPHEKSMSIKELANHLAEIPSWITGTMDHDSMDLSGYKSPAKDSVKEIIELLKKNNAEAEKALQKPDEEFSKNWKMIVNGETAMEMPKYNVLQAVVMNQFPHHRAQLGVYFRLLDISVPSTYGPSADES